MLGLVLRAPTTCMNDFGPPKVKVRPPNTLESPAPSLKLWSSWSPRSSGLWWYCQYYLPYSTDYSSARLALWPKKTIGPQAFRFVYLSLCGDRRSTSLKEKASL